jgi:hypothetical protein
MKKHTRLVAVVFALGLVGVALGAWARGRTPTQTQMQTQAKTHIQVPVVAARAEDVGSIEAIVRADYECISGGVWVARQWGRDLSLFDANARFYQVVKDAKGGGVNISAPTWQEFTDESDAEMVKGGFSEHELAHKIYRYGKVATVFSSAEGKLAATGEVVARAVNIYQLYYAGGRWWISSVSWDAERLINEIPPELQPAK